MIVCAAIEAGIELGASQRIPLIVGVGQPEIEIFGPCLRELHGSVFRIIHYGSNVEGYGSENIIVHPVALMPPQQIRHKRFFVSLGVFIGGLSDDYVIVFVHHFLHQPKSLVTSLRIIVQERVVNSGLKKPECAEVCTHVRIGHEGTRLLSGVCPPPVRLGNLYKAPHEILSAAHRLGLAFEADKPDLFTGGTSGFVAAAIDRRIVLFLCTGTDTKCQAQESDI